MCKIYIFLQWIFTYFVQFNSEYRELYVSGEVHLSASEIKDIFYVSAEIFFLVAAIQQVSDMFAAKPALWGITTSTPKEAQLQYQPTAISLDFCCNYQVPPKSQTTTEQ